MNKLTKWSAYDAVPSHKAEKRAKMIRQVNLTICEKVTKLRGLPMMQFPITRLKSMQSRLDKLLGLQAAQRAMRARPNYTIYKKLLN